VSNEMTLAAADDTVIADRPPDDGVVAKFAPDLTTPTARN